MQTIYLDYNSYSKPKSRAIEAFLEVASLPLNPSAQHLLGQKAFSILENARDTVKSSVGAENYGVIFTATATEANNLAIKGTLNVDLYLASKAEHKSILRVLPENNQLINLNADSSINRDDLLTLLQNSKDKKTLLSIIHSNNETGVINDLRAIVLESRLIHKNLIIHTDISQSVGKIPVNLEALDVDMATIAGYKFGAVPGAAALIYRKKFTPIPQILGGGQEDKLRSGTENVPAIHAMSTLLESLSESILKMQSIRLIRDKLELSLRKIHSDVIIFGESSNRLPNTSFFAIPGLLSKNLLIHCNRKNICIGFGSSCSTGLEETSHVLQAMQLGSEISDCAARISLGAENTWSDCEAFLALLRSLKKP